MVVFQFDIGDPTIFGELRILFEDRGSEDSDWSRLDDDDDHAAAQDLAPAGYSPAIFYNGKCIAHYDGPPLDSLVVAYGVALELVEDHCDTLLQTYEEQGVRVEAHRLTGEYSETRRIIGELRSKFEVDRNRTRKQKVRVMSDESDGSVDPPRTAREDPIQSHRYKSREDSKTEARKPKSPVAKKSETIESLRELGLPESEKFASLWPGLDSTEILDAIDRGFPNSNVYLQLREVCADYDDVVHYDPEVLRFLKVGASLSAAEWLVKSSNIQPETVARWIREGLAEEKLVTWAKHDPNCFRSAQRVAETMTWAALGFDPAQRAKWTNEGLQLADAEEIIDETFTVAVATRWLSAGWPPREARQWFACGFNNMKEAANWRTSFKPEEATSWKEIGVKNVAVAVEWSTHFSAHEASQWVSAGLSPRVASRRRSAGLSPR